MKPRFKLKPISVNFGKGMLTLSFMVEEKSDVLNVHGEEFYSHSSLNCSVAITDDDDGTVLLPVDTIYVDSLEEVQEIANDGDWDEYFLDAITPQPVPLYRATIDNINMIDSRCTGFIFKIEQYQHPVNPDEDGRFVPMDDDGTGVVITCLLKPGEDLYMVGTTQCKGTGKTPVEAAMQCLNFFGHEDKFHIAKYDLTSIECIEATIAEISEKVAKATQKAWDEFREKYMK